MGRAEFQFFLRNHSVGRAEYGQPCIPYEDTGENKVGFYSGFFPVNRILTIVSELRVSTMALLILGCSRQRGT